MDQSEKVCKMIDEFVDLVDLGTDDIPNAEQKGAFVAEGTEALMAFYNLATDLPKSEYDEALEMLGIALIGKIAENKVKHSDGSGYLVTVEAIVAPNLPAEEEVEAPEGEDHTPID